MIKTYFIKTLIIYSILIFQLKQIVAQKNYDVDILSAQFHSDRRQALRNIMEENSVAFIISNPERNRSNDVDFQFHQDPDFFYLTGCIEPNSVLLIFKNENKENKF